MSYRNILQLESTQSVQTSVKANHKMLPQNIVHWVILSLKFNSEKLMISNILQY